MWTPTAGGHRHSGRVWCRPPTTPRTHRDRGRACRPLAFRSSVRRWKAFSTRSASSELLRSVSLFGPHWNSSLSPTTHPAVRCLFFFFFFFFFFLGVCVCVCDAVVVLLTRPCCLLSVVVSRLAGTPWMTPMDVSFLNYGNGPMYAGIRRPPSVRPASSLDASAVSSHHGGNPSITGLPQTVNPQLPVRTSLPASLLDRSNASLSVSPDMSYRCVVALVGAIVRSRPQCSRLKAGKPGVAVPCFVA